MAHRAHAHLRYRRRAHHRPFTFGWWAELAVPTHALTLGTLTDRDCSDTMKLAHW